MPYFTRQPYAATVRPAVAEETPDILALAAEVLGAETGSVGPFRLRAPIRAGGGGKIVLGLTAEGAPVATRLAVSDLTGPAGAIPAGWLKIDPPELVLAPGQSADVTVAVTAPAGTLPGTYTGRITASGEGGFSAPVTVTVTA